MHVKGLDFFTLIERPGPGRRRRPKGRSEAEHLDAAEHGGIISVRRRLHGVAFVVSRLLHGVRLLNFYERAARTSGLAGNWNITLMPICSGEISSVVVGVVGHDASTRVQQALQFLHCRRAIDPVLPRELVLGVGKRGAPVGIVLTLPSAHARRETGAIAASQ
jgi:hypothetical protein